MFRVAVSQGALSSTARRPTCAGLAVAIVFCATAASAQTVEIAPFGGYRFGGDLFEIAAGRPLDLDGATVLGGAVNVELSDGLWFEALFTRQQAHVDVAHAPFGAATRVRVVVDQWLAGGRQELRAGRVRPFLTGLVGLTRYGADRDNEVRFAVGGGGGVRLPLQSRVGLRFDGRLFTTFVDANAYARACGAENCLVFLDLDVAWQMEFTADLVVAFGSRR